MWKEERIGTSVNIGKRFSFFLGIEKPARVSLRELEGCGKCTGLRNEMSVHSGVSMQ